MVSTEFKETIQYKDPLIYTQIISQAVINTKTLLSSDLTSMSNCQIKPLLSLSHRPWLDDCVISAGCFDITWWHIWLIIDRIALIIG